MSAHTPGPWHVTKGLYGRKEENTIWGPENEEGCCAKVCTVDGPYTTDADAALIAAAPDLLEACQFALDLPGLIAEYRSSAENTTGAGSEIDAVLAALRAAIAKATGDESGCPGHIASDADPKVCGRCGVHIDSLRPEVRSE